jgi:hypothetical protein
MLLCAALCAGVLAGCGKAVSTSGFSGAEREVAQTIANLQTDATASDQKKICGEVLSASVVASLGGRQGCEAALKTQLTQIDNLEATVQTVKVSGTMATASVVAIHEGKKHLETVTLVKESGGWRISGLK